MLLMGMFMFTACPSDDDEDENNGKKPQNTVVEPGVFGRVRVTSTGKIKIYYRDDGTVESVSVSGYIHNFTEDQKILSREAGDGIHTWELTYNKQGLVSTITYTHPKKSFYSYTATCTYNNNRLIKIDHATEGGSGVIDLVWEDDCIDRKSVV